MMPVGRPIGFEWTGLDVFLRYDFFLNVGPDLMVQQTIENRAGDDRFAEHLATGAGALIAAIIIDPRS